ncbi:MAG: AmmeMemoRadiSam system protein B [Anaerolineales bacterium]
MSLQEVRAPAVAGAFYPRSILELNQMLDTYLSRADPAALDGVRAVIVPHAGYIYSGPIAAFGYKVLAEQEQSPTRIYLLGPSHRGWFPGVALADYEAFQTPLGNQPVDQEALHRLADDSDLFHLLPHAHDNEHSLEVQLPFLQRLYPDVPIVPILFGNVDPEEVGRVLVKHLEAQDLIVVSSDLSHYHDYTEARRLDQTFLDALLSNNPAQVDQGEACGRAPILALMTIAEEQGWEPHLLDYRSSGDTAGDRAQVVGYAAIAYAEARDG